MALLPIKLAPGVYRNGTDFEAQGRWRDANLVRWSQGSLRPVGGWQEKHDVTAAITAPPRAAHAWQDNSGGSNFAIATAHELVYVNESGTAYDITPTGFTTGDADAARNTAFGGTFFGTGFYGVKRPDNGTFQEADTWAIDNWGEYLVGCCTSDGKLYEWQLNTASPAAAITNAPTGCKSMIVTEERFILALAPGGNPRKVQWCDREDNTTWTPLATNEAGDIELQTSGLIMTGVRMRGRSLIVTTTDAHIATYVGAPYVYGFERVGTACGAISRRSLVAIDQGAFWMGREAFFIFDGSSARQIDCDVADYVFEDLNSNQVSKVNAVHNSEYGEIWWFYPSEGSTECDRYVAYDYLENHWEIGQINRTCGADQGVFSDPRWIDATGIIYEHELHGFHHGGLIPYAETAPITLGNGDQVMRVNQLIADEGHAGEVQVKFKTRFTPNGEETEHGAYTLDGGVTPVRFTGRQVRMRVEATGHEDWRVGVMRIKTETGGTR